jgi:hypothetical protein
VFNAHPLCTVYFSLRSAQAAAVNRGALQFPNGVGQTVQPLRGQVNISQQQRIAASTTTTTESEWHQDISTTTTAVNTGPGQGMLEAQQQAQAQAQGQQGQTPVPQQVQSGQAQPQQPAIQIQTHNLPGQPVAQPLVTAMQFANGKSASPPPQQTVPSNSGTPVSINGAEWEFERKWRSCDSETRIGAKPRGDTDSFGS